MAKPVPLSSNWILNYGGLMHWRHQLPKHNKTLLQHIMWYTFIFWFQSSTRLLCHELCLSHGAWLGISTAYKNIHSRTDRACEDITINIMLKWAYFCYLHNNCIIGSSFKQLMFIAVLFHCLKHTKKKPTTNKQKQNSNKLKALVILTPICQQY